MRAKKTVAKGKKAASKAVSSPKASPPATNKTPAKLKSIAKPKTISEKVATPKSPKLPAVLLEGDFPTAPQVSGPGEKYALGPTPPLQTFTGGGDGDLPEAYGTKRLFLTARDPHWLYANWDLTREQQADYNRQSKDGHLVLRIYYAPPGGGLALEVHVHPESRYWFAHVDRAATKYTSELGFYGKSGTWNTISRSGATLTPPEVVSGQAGIEFATIPPEVSFHQLVALVQSAVGAHQPLARAVEELRREGHPELPTVTPTPIKDWTPAQERALAAIVTVDEVRRVWIGSMEITELVRRQFEKEISSQAAAQFGLPPSPLGGASISSPFGGEERREKGFWFNVNAELIIYGATERDATVSIGGRNIKLRPDGSFSYRFSLPDGRYDLPVVAVSADGTDGRAAELKFTRSTEIRGDVGTHPQDPELKPPTADNV